MKNKPITAVLCSSILITLVLVGCGTLSPSGQPPMPRPPTTLDRMLFQISTQHVAQVYTQEVIRTVIQEVEVPVIREVVRHVTNDVGTVHIQTIQYTNYVYVTNSLHVTNSIVGTNLTPVYGYETKPVVQDIQGSVTTIGNMIAPGLGGLAGILVGGAVGFYKAWKERKANKVLAQGIQTGRELIKLGNDPSVDMAYKEYLKDNQKAVDVFNLVSGIVEKHVDKGEAKQQARDLITDARATPHPPA